MKKWLTCFVLLNTLFVLAACAPRTNDPAELITANKARELQLLGKWDLAQLRDGASPQSHQKRTMTFQNDGILKVDLWEHQLTYTYEVMPDPDHLRLVWTASTNPNDTPGAVVTHALAIQDGTLTLDGDQYKRTALANGATVTPAKGAATQRPGSTPEPAATQNPASTREGEVSARLGENVALHVGQTAKFTDSPDQFGLTFYQVKQDSRCPQGVTCVWAGEVRIGVTFEENGLMHPPILEMTSNPADPLNRRVIQGYLVEFVDIQPPSGPPGASIAPEEYVGTFLVTVAQATPTPPSNALTGALDQPITLKWFQTVNYPQADMTIQFNGVLEDTRCPSRVNCAQAGRALVSLKLERDGKLGFVQLSTSPPDGRRVGYFQGYAIELLAVEPYPATVGQQIPDRDYSVTIVARKIAPPLVVNKNQGIALKVGQTATLEDENVKVTFVRVQSDSRCPFRMTCAVRGNAVVEATLTMPDGAIQTFILNEDNHTPNQRIPDTGNFGMELLTLNPYPQADGASQELAQDDYEALLVVRKYATSQTPAPIPTALSSCGGLTREDAEGILGEPVQPSPRLTTRIFAAPFDDDSEQVTHGLCGYESVSAGKRDILRAGEPQVDSSDRTRYAVAYGRLNGATVMELLRVADIVRGANLDADTTPYLIIKTRLGAGDWTGLLEDFRKLPEGAPQVEFEEVDSFGDEGLWVWREAALNNYAALLVRDRDSFVVLEALTPKNITRAAAEESMHAAMGKLIP